MPDVQRPLLAGLPILAVHIHGLGAAVGRRLLAVCSYGICSAGTHLLHSLHQAPDQLMASTV